MNLRNVVGTAISAPFARKHTRGEPQTWPEPQDEPLLSQHTAEGQNTPRNGFTYGAVDREGGGSGWSSRRASPEIHRRDSTLNRVPEEEIQEDFLAEESEVQEQELEEQGLYFGMFYSLQ